MIFSDNRLTSIGWDAFHSLPLEDKGHYLQRDHRPYHTIFSQQFDRAFLDRIGEVATRIRQVGKTKGGMNFLQSLLSEKRAMLYFTQPSTRTFLSFYAACQIVGLRQGEVRDTTTSSEMKGESQEDSIRTFSSYYDVIIMRHTEPGLAERIAWFLSNTDRPVPVINAGSGKDQHPTQALLDIYTLQRSFEDVGGIEGKSIAFVGDLLRGRTVRSLARLLSLYPGVTMHFVAPESLQIGEDILQSLDASGVTYHLHDALDPVVPLADAIYMTRIQDEWDTGDEEPIDLDSFSFGPKQLVNLKKDGVIMHPLPRRQEIDPAIDHDPRAVYWRQVRNGMWVRAALFLMIFEREGEVDRYYADLVR